MSKRKELLVSMLKDPDHEVVAAAAASLERIENLAGLNEVIELLKKGSIPEKVRAIYALGTIGGESVLKPLVYCASRPEDDLKGAAIDVLGNLAEHAATPVLLERLKDGNSGIRARAIKALGKMGDAALTPHLLPFLDAGDGLTDVEAVLAVATIGGISVEERLTKLASSSVPATRAAVATALGMLKPA